MLVAVDTTDSTATTECDDTEAEVADAGPAVVDTGPAVIDTGPAVVDNRLAVVDAGVVEVIIKVIPGTGDILTDSEAAVLVLGADDVKATAVAPGGTLGLSVWLAVMEMVWGNRVFVPFALSCPCPRVELVLLPAGLLGGVVAVAVAL